MCPDGCRNLSPIGTQPPGLPALLCPWALAAVVPLTQPPLCLSITQAPVSKRASYSSCAPEARKGQLYPKPVLFSTSTHVGMAACPAMPSAPERGPWLRGARLADSACSPVTAACTVAARLARRGLGFGGSTLCSRQQLPPRVWLWTERRSLYAEAPGCKSPCSIILPQTTPNHPVC